MQKETAAEGSPRTTNSHEKFASVVDVVQTLILN